MYTTRDSLSMLSTLTCSCACVACTGYDLDLHHRALCNSIFHLMTTEHNHFHHSIKPLYPPRAGVALPTIAPSTSPTKKHSTSRDAHLVVLFARGCAAARSPRSADSHSLCYPRRIPGDRCTSNTALQILPALMMHPIAPHGYPTSLVHRPQNPDVLLFLSRSAFTVK